jgi:hypothetical protein
MPGVILPIQRVHGCLARVVWAPTRNATDGSTRTNEDNFTPVRALTERRGSSFQCSNQRVHINLEVRPPCVQGRAGRSNPRRGIQSASVQYQTIQATILGRHRLYGPGECDFIGSVQIISERLGREDATETGMLHWTICKVSGCASARAFSSDERVREMAMTVALNLSSKNEVAARPIPLFRRRIRQNARLLHQGQGNLEAPVTTTTDIDTDRRQTEALLMPVCKGSDVKRAAPKMGKSNIRISFAVRFNQIIPFSFSLPSSSRSK